MSPVFVELPPLEFVFQDHAELGMVSAYLGWFSVYRVLGGIVSKPKMNCVVTCLLFGHSPRLLLNMVSRSHSQVRGAKVWYSFK